MTELANVLRTYPNIALAFISMVGINILTVASVAFHYATLTTAPLHHAGPPASLLIWGVWLLAVDLFLVLAAAIAYSPLAVIAKVTSSR